MKRDNDPTVIGNLHPESLPLQGKPRRVPVLIVLEGGQENVRFMITQPESTLGRSLKADITLEDSLASRIHCRLDFANCGVAGVIPDCRLYDLDSTNGTFVNGERVGEEGAWLSDRDRIRIGSTLLGFFIRDEEELRRTSDLEEKALRDSLTGLNNLACLKLILDREFAISKENCTPFSVILVDVDRFKEVNHRLGTLAADQVLRHIAERLDSIRRASDFLARQGGEQFAFLLPRVDSHGAFNLAERIRTGISDSPFAFEQENFRLTVSIGIESLSDGIPSSKILFDRADLALSEAKKGGGNRIAVYRIEDPIH